MTRKTNVSGEKPDTDRFLMCPPNHFGVNYVINPWMEGNIGRVNRREAVSQWNNLRYLLSSVANIEMATPAPGLPDMVFTANAGLALDNEVVVSRFSTIERQPEEALFRRWFESSGYMIHHAPEELHFEGGGDALLDFDGRWIWAAYGSRTSLESHPYLATIFNIEVISVRLVDPRFYHLDTCFLPLPDGYVMYYPDALDTYSNRVIQSRVSLQKRITINIDDALLFAANAVVTGDTIIMNKCSARLAEKLRSIGLTVAQTELSEFIKAGGSAKCLTLKLNQKAPENRNAISSVSRRRVVAEGQLIDSQLMSRICDSIVNGGGSFQVTKMQLGQRRNELSSAQLDVSAPDNDTLDILIQKIIRLGAAAPSGETENAALEKVTQDGVAPGNFYSTTIYATQVRVNGDWIDVADQRMDGVVVVSGGAARCSLLRDLKKGDMVVTGGEGIRTMRAPARYGDHEQFGFMASSISSERRVEIAVDKIAWEMNRIHARGGRFVVVAGPVVVHTGATPYLAKMVRNGYINALLGGNAIAVHDIELALFGTSLGVNLKNGKSVEGGHRNHIAAINSVRKAGSIKGAVESGVVTSGLFYELVKNGIPFSLAGSIRDDGPLPETRMDLIEAQEEYASLIKGADMILMLSSMLHSIGAGNMTPAGARLVCVDINPAVITKLTDRGSLESVGVVTDVGLFLSMLAGKLNLDVA